jgi:hypothetical protein
MHRMTHAIPRWLFFIFTWSRLPSVVTDYQARVLTSWSEVLIGNWRPFTQEIPRLLWNPKFHSNVHKNWQLQPTLSQMNLVCILLFHSYCHDLGVCDYRRGMDWWMDLLTTCVHHSELHFTVPWRINTNVLSMLQSPLAVSWQQI